MRNVLYLPGQCIPTDFYLHFPIACWNCSVHGAIGSELPAGPEGRAVSWLLMY